MSFSFIHCADIHLDSPLKGLGAYSLELAECFRSASRQAFVNLVDAAIAQRVAFVVIAGDIFDGDWRDYQTGLFFVREMARLGQEGISVYAITGNHDAAAEMTRTLPYPENVKFFKTAAAHTIIDEQTGAALHGQSFDTRWTEDNLALNYPPAQAGRLNIGILHTACEGSAEHANYAPCTVEQLRNHGYQYWALGHVHGRAELSSDPYVVFPGNIQGRHVRETGAKGFCLVEVSDHEITGVTHVCCDVARWCELTVAVDDECGSLDDIFEQVRGLVSAAAADAEGKPLAVRVTLSGVTELHWELISDQAQLRADMEAQLLHGGDEVMLEKLRIKTSPPPSERLPDPDHLDMVAELVHEMDNADVMGILMAEIQEHMTSLQAKVPGKEMVLPGDDELADILAEAKSLVAARLSLAEAPTDAH